VVKHGETRALPRLQVDQPLSRVVQGREVTVELLNYRKSGERFWNLLSMTPVRDRAGNLMSYIGVQSDITELIRRKEAEQELQARASAVLTHSRRRMLSLSVA